MNRFFERLTTSSMSEYPHNWAESCSSGCISRYCAEDGFVLHGPKKGEFVFRTNQEGETAYRVTYENEKTRRLRVRRTGFVVQYNQVLRDHIKRHVDGLHPSDSRVSLIAAGVNSGD